MERENRVLLAIVVVLGLSVVVTGGLAVYLTLAHEGREVAGVPGEQAADARRPSAASGTANATHEPRIAFVSDQEGDIAIYVMNADGSDPRRVSEPSQHFCFSPIWSPDGQRLAYLGMDGNPFEEEDNADGNPITVQVWVSAADGSAHVHVSREVSQEGTYVLGLDPTWSPDGTRLALAATVESAEGDDPRSVIHVVRADGQGVERSITLPWMVHHLTWSPTAPELLIASESPGAGMVVHVLSSDGGEVTEVFRGTQTAAWSPDGRAVVVGDYSSQEVIIIDVGQGDQTQAPRTVAQTTMQPVQLAWSPDGAHIAIATTGHYRQDYATVLRVLTLETGELTTVVEGAGWLGWPNWSPDGRHLGFTWGQMGWRGNLPFADLWVYDVASGELTPLAAGEAFEGEGVWSP
jgi:Tol biopolymer transport system component